MDKKDLLQLEKLAALTPAEIAAQYPELSKKIGERVSINLKNNALARVSGASARIRDGISKLNLSPENLGKNDIKAVLAKSLTTGRLSAKVKQEIEAELATIPDLGRVEDVLPLDVPVLANPVFQRDLMKAGVYRLAGIVGLTGSKADRALVKDFSINTMSDEKLVELVDAKILTDAEAKNLGLAGNLFALFDASFELTEFVTKNGVPGITGKISTLEDLTKLDRSDWTKIVTASKAALPDNIKPQEYADILSRKVANLFPGKTLAFRATRVDRGTVTKNLNALKPLFDQNTTVFGAARFDDLKKGNLTDAQTKTLRDRYETVARISRMHPGLRIHEILDDKSLSAAEKSQRVVERVGLLDRFIGNNPEVDYLYLNYTHDSQDIPALNFAGFKPEEKNMVLGSLKSYQRVASFTDDIEHTEAIMAAGYHSAAAVTSVTLAEFVNDTKLDLNIATNYYEKAHSSIIRTTGLVGSVLDILTGSFAWTNVGNVDTSVQDYLKDIPGYQDFFGQVAFCDCAWCQSIHSPAAYFVDLMRWVEKYVIKKHFTGTNASDVLNLKVRLPDLWTLPLTCDNTTTLIPYLDIINEILEAYIASQRSFTGSLSDRAAVEQFVYRNLIALEAPGTWKNNVHAFTQPFHLPLESLATYLSHFERTRFQVAKLLNMPPDVVATARLHLSEKEFQLIAVPNNTPAFLSRVYHITFTVHAGKVKPFDAQLLLKPMGINRNELGRLIKTRFVTNNGADNITIQGEKISNSSVQNDIERIKNLTFDALDRAHRFIRLLRKTPWTIEELDLILTHLAAKGIAAGISTAAVIEIGHLVDIQAKLSISVEELCALWGTIPTLPAAEGQKSLFDTLFNHEDVVLTDGTYPKNTTPFIHPALVIDHSTAGAEFASGRLMTAFNASDADVLALIKNLAGVLGIVNINSAAESDRGFNLTLDNLSLLYRHARVASTLDISIDELFQLIDLMDSLPNGWIENTGHLRAVMEFYEWWKTTAFSLDELHFVIKSANLVAPENFISRDEVAQFVLDQTVAENALLFADTVFAFTEAINEAQSKAIIAANAATIELSPDGKNYRLKTAFDPAAALTVPAGIPTPEPELRAVLVKYHPQSLIPHFLASRLNLTAGQITALIQALGINLDADGYALELQGVTAPAVLIPALVEKLIPLSVLFKDQKFDLDVLTYVLANLALFGINALDSLTIDNIKQLHRFVQFVKKQEDNSYNIALVGEVLGGFTAATQYQTVDQAKLARLLETDAGLLATIHPVMPPLTTALESLSELDRLVELCAYLGIGGNILPLMVSFAYDDLQQAAAAILAAFRTKYKSEAERKEKLEAYQDKLRGRKRASLTTFMTHSGFAQFEDENDLFHYFLIDTELEGCARTSRLVAATMSVQLYIHRILLNLEQDDKAPGAAGKIHVRADDLPGDEWEWRKNYRVWEANRKVFLYPENYIEPELRDDKTPLFEELEDELLQQDINADTVLDAYGKYMRGFDEVAHLKIAGSYHETDEPTKTDVLHLLGVTADEPPLYYYRTVENLYYSEKDANRGVVWGPWRKINVQIPVCKAAPIIFNGRLHVFWVRVTTLAKTVFDDNRSVFTGYEHKFSIEFTTLKLDGTWTPPQKLNLFNGGPFHGNGGIQDPLAERVEIEAFAGALHDALRSFPFFDFDSVNNTIRDLRTPRYDVVPHFEPIDEYTLTGFMWDQVYPAVNDRRLVLTGVGYQMRAAIDFYNLSVQNAGGRFGAGREALKLTGNKPGKILVREGNRLYRGRSPSSQLFDNYAYGSLVVNITRGDSLLVRHWNDCTLDNSFDNVRQEQIATLSSGDTIAIVNGSFSDAIIDSQGDLLLLQGSVVSSNGFLLKRIGTTLSETLTRTLFTSGVDTMLDITTQKALKELAAPISLNGSGITNRVVKDKIDYTGPYGTYYREVFFHIPALIANHLNSQGKYAEAQKWYHYIFDPTATEVIDVSDPSLTAAQKKKKQLDRNWRYLEFRQITAQTLRQQLQDKQAIEVYKKDPFNPHAIARLRLSAYQKNIVMKYIDNLLDWGDYLFAQDTMESINEATLLYVIAKEILGDRPVELGDCGEGRVSPKTYERISPLLDKGSEFLAELEHYTYVPVPPFRERMAAYAYDAYRVYEASRKAAHDIKITTTLNYTPVATGVMNLAQLNQVNAVEARFLPEVTVREVDDDRTGQFARGIVRAFDWQKKNSIYAHHFYKLPSFGVSILSHVSPVFCVPGNKELLEYWKRVDDRLFKIRNCMNIQGQRRQLALFAPEIDPRFLVRARAAGLSLDDILNALSGNLPPYRFSYIIERAKAYTALVQGFGAALLSALEKKDGEELAQLRVLHQQNILEMTAKSRKLEIDSANEGIKALNDRIASLTYQLEYYGALIAEDLNPAERTQQIARHALSAIRTVEAVLGFLGGTLTLVPQLGSPFAMKYGGVELGGSISRLATATGTTALVLENVGASAGLEAGFERRSQGWKHQRKVLQSELEQTTKNLRAAEIRRDILIEAQTIHQTSIDHNNEVMEFYQDKFSNLGLYTWLSATMQRLYKEAFNNATAIARLAEQAYRFERDDNTFFIEGNYYETPRAGLLAGERLMMALQAMERRYLETNYRKNEIDQAFSLTQINPAALLLLKQTGSCEFSIPEIFFDLFYPGQYRRKIQSVRLTIPSVTGPYTNVSATLSLLHPSHIRVEASTSSAALKPVPASRTTTIATSTALNDAGVFQLNFRDDRYMPFEGAGAISRWKLTLPKEFRQFDYNTINDVIIHISYTADYDEVFRDTIEGQNASLQGTLLNVLKNGSLSRTLSLRQEFSTDFHRLTQQSVNQPVTLKIQNKHFPLFMNGRSLKIKMAKLILVTSATQTANNVDIILKGVSQTGFTRDPSLGNLFSKNLGNLFNAGILIDHTMAIANGGDLAPAATPAGPAAAIDPEKLEDIILYLEYSIA